MNEHPETVPAPFPPLPLAAQQPVGTRKLRVCIASFDFLGPVRNGGVGTAFTSLGEALAGAGHEVTLLYLSGTHCETREPLEHWIAEYRKKGIRFALLPAQSGPQLENTAWHIGRSYEAYQWLLGEKFDLVHFSEWCAPGYHTIVAKHQGLAFADTTLCVHTHGPTLWGVLSNGQYLTQISEVELDFMERESVRLADVVASPSQYLLRWMLERDWVLAPKTFVQQYVRPTAARPLSVERDFERRKITELVFFGRLEVRKGLVLFCDALDRLVQDPAMRDVQVTFLGKHTKINQQVSDEYLAGRSQAWPWRTQIIADRDQYGAVDYLQGEGRLAVIPSLVDNLPNTVLECLGARVPFLASTTGGIPEMVAEADRPETLFPLRAPLLAEKLQAALVQGVRPARFAVEPEANTRAWLSWHAELPSAAASIPRLAEGKASDQPLVSICVVHFNRPNYLRQALASIEAQNYPNFEVVVVDDASSKPEAIAYLDGLAPQFSARGWRLIRNPENLYVGASRNVAARAARGEYLKFLDDDNVGKPHEVSTFVRVAQRTGADIVSCALDFFWGQTAPAHNQVPKSRFLFLGPAAAAGALRNYFGDTNSLFRRDVFLELGGFHEERNAGTEDWQLLAEAVLGGRHLEVIPDALVWYRRTDSGDNVSATNAEQAKHMQNIRPYLRAVPPALRSLVLYAQGASLRPNLPADELPGYAKHTIRWKAKLEAGIALAALQQDKAAATLMVDGIKAVQSCGIPRVVLEALVEIPAHLAPLDPGRARYLLNLAVKLAESHGRTEALTSAQRQLAALPPERPDRLAARAEPAVVAAH